MKNVYLIKFLISMAFILLVTGCVPRISSGTRPSIEPTTPASLTQATPISEWEKTVKAAQKEGRVVVYSTGGPEIKAALVQAFKEKYGLPAEYITVMGAGMAQKILTERRAGLYLADVYLGGAITAVNLLKPAEVLDPLEPALILPEVTDSKVWIAGKLDFVDKARTILTFLSYAVPTMVVNSDLVKPEDIKSYSDLLHPRWKGKVILNDPTTTGTAIVWFGVTSEKIMDLDFMHKLAMQEPMINRDWRLQIEWLAHGKYAVVLAPHSATVGNFIQSGAPIRWVVPIEGTHRTGGGGQIALVNKAPHPNAARLFTNWLLTRETQNLYSKVALLPSGRTDVPTGDLDSATLIQPGVKYFKSDEEDFILGDPKRMKLAQEIFGPLLKR